jgi:hypothetical protein
MIVLYYSKYNRLDIFKECIMKNKISTLLRGLLILLGVAVLLVFVSTQRVSAKEELNMPYLIKVNRVHNTITIYEEDETGEFSVPVKAMICSVGAKGTQTVTGTYNTKEKYRWKALLGDVWGQYATRIVGGILFHSVYYYENANPATLATKEYNKLGSAASHGCIRLTVGDAKWIYDNCSVGTTVVIYDDKSSPGPLGKPEAIKLPVKVKWDPTDPSDKNPYKNKLPQITGVKDLETTWGEEADLLNGVKAKSTVGLDITSKLSVEGEVNYYVPGEYEVTYSVTDALGRKGAKIIIVTVGEYPLTPNFVGIRDKILNREVIIDDEFVLQDVEVFCGDRKLDRKLIDIIIQELSETEYYIIYQITTKEGATAKAYATILIDKEAPTFTGIVDKQLGLGEVLTEALALDHVTVMDNLTKPEDIDIKLTFDEKPDGSYQVNYIATDEAGNVAEAKAIIFRK